LRPTLPLLFAFPGLNQLQLSASFCRAVLALLEIRHAGPRNFRQSRFLVGAHARKHFAATVYAVTPRDARAVAQDFQRKLRGCRSRKILTTCATVQTSKPVSTTRPPARGIVAIRRNGESQKMQHLTILCLSLGLAGCYSTGPYANANGDGPVVDFSACADKADTRVDPLCHPLTRTSRQSAQTTTANQQN